MLYVAAYDFFVLHFANKGMHEFSVKKVVMMCLIILVALVTGLLT
jgi:hypothetical protein